MTDDQISKNQCSIGGCEKPILAKRLCSAHYQRMQKHGNPLAGSTLRGAPLAFFENEVLKYEGDDCLIWPFSRDQYGYAQLWHQGRLAIVSRLVCEHKHGPAPTDKHQAAHSCGKGSKGCVNLRHLRWATRLENEADKFVHGTANRSGRQLTESDVLAIRAMPGTQCEIAERFGVTQSMVSLIKSGRKWRHVTEEVVG